jgi:signal transduction histidine kinase/DNA-binding response OmpR family regulator
MVRLPLTNIDQAEIRFLVEKNADGIIVVDEDGVVMFANPATEQIFGRAPASLIGSPVGLPLVTGETTEITIHRPGGGQVDAEIRVVETRWGNRPAQLATLRDISARRAIEEQLRHSTKMEAVGRLTAGIAHDFNNLLTVVLGNLELAQRQTEAGPLLRPLENATRGARRAAVLTERLLAFSRKKPLEPRVLNANGLVSGMSDLLQRTLGESVNVLTSLSGDVWAVEVDPTELEAALLNLAVNARDAMPRGGDLIIETSNVELVDLDDSRHATNGPITQGAYVLISVADTGSGMAPDVLDHIFEPFFTTKVGGRGTGLGLSQVYGFVKQSGGHVRVASKPNSGTVVKIYLPRVRGPVAAQEPERAREPDQAQSGNRAETILVVEDDEDVRNYTVGSLRELGYSVVEAGDAPSGLRMIEDNPNIRLLFTDLGLPGGMDGKALADQAQQVRGDLRILITTAYAGESLIRGGRLDAGIDLLTKPFTFSALANRIRELLDRDSLSRSGKPRLLIVDDEVLVRMLLIEAVTEAGYEVEDAGSFAEAFGKFRARPTAFSAAVVDLGLPDKPGDQLIAAMRRIQPELPVVLATGLAKRDLDPSLTKDARMEVVTKPFDIDNLLGTLRRLRPPKNRSH